EDRVERLPLIYPTRRLSQKKATPREESPEKPTLLASTRFLARLASLASGPVHAHAEQAKTENARDLDDEAKKRQRNRSTKITRWPWHDCPKPLRQYC